MRTLSFLAGLFVLFGFSVAGQAAEPNALAPVQKEAGWVLLFDGRSLAGWKPTSDADWKATDGEIRATKGAQGWLMTEKEYGDFELHVEFKAPPSTNSGVFFRTPLAPTDPAKDCYELNIAPTDNPFPTASLVGRAKVSVEPEDDTVVAPEGLRRRHVGGPRQPLNPWDGNWHAFDLVVEGAATRISLDDQLLTTVFIEDKASLPGSGHIGLQFREGPVAFRNIRLREITETGNHEGTKE